MFGTLESTRLGKGHPVDSNELVILTAETEARARGILLSSPRELSGGIISAIDGTLNVFEESNSTAFVDEWYRSAEIASYNSTAAAAAYLGAYGARSILKYQEALFALLLIRGGFRKHTRIVDYGAGPCVGFAALVDLWQILFQYTGEPVSMEYVAIDRSEHMLEVGQDLCRRIAENSNINIAYTLLHASEFEHADPHILITANVMNDGEGNLNCRDFLADLRRNLNSFEDIIIIEPATEQPARQMCGLAEVLAPAQHIGPCPSAGCNCNEWSFRQFAKRIYSFERRCLGQWASAARICKYSLALLSAVTARRSLPDYQYVVVGQRSTSGYALTCHLGRKKLMRIDPKGSPWDVVNQQGQVERWWP